MRLTKRLVRTFLSTSSVKCTTWVGFTPTQMTLNPLQLHAESTANTIELVVRIRTTARNAGMALAVLIQILAPSIFGWTTSKRRSCSPPSNDNVLRILISSIFLWLAALATLASQEEFLKDSPST
jgi:hypothetical protein